MHHKLYRGEPNLDSSELLHGLARLLSVCAVVCKVCVYSSRASIKMMTLYLNELRTVTITHVISFSFIQALSMVTKERNQCDVT